MLADEIFDLREEMAELSEKVSDGEGVREEDALMVRAIDHLAERIDLIAGRIAKA